MHTDQFVDVQLPTEIANVILKDLKESLVELKSKEQQLVTAIRNLETGKTVNSSIPTMNADRKVTHTDTKGLGRKTGSRNKHDVRVGLLNEIKKTVGNSNSPVTSMEIARNLMHLYKYDKQRGALQRKSLKSLHSSVSAILNQYRVGGKYIPYFDRTTNDKGAWIWDINTKPITTK